MPRPPKAKPPAPAPAKSAVTVVPITDLIADPANLRKRDARARATLRGSVARFGAARSVVLDGNNVIRAGNGTIEAGIEQGYTEVLVVEPGPGQMVAVKRSDWSASEACGYAVADNRTSDLSGFEEADLAKTLRALQSEDFDLAAVGYTDDEVDRLCEGIASELADAPEAASDAEADGDGAAGEDAGGHEGGDPEWNPAIRFELVFDDTAQQDRWFRFVKWLKSRPDYDAATIAGRIDRFLSQGDFAG